MLRFPVRRGTLHVETLLGVLGHALLKMARSLLSSVVPWPRK